MAGQHVCQFGDRWCGRWGYDDLCDYCKRKYDLELQNRDNQMAGERAMRNREAQHQANEALGQLIVEHPVAAGVGLLAALGLGFAMSKDSEPQRRPALKHGKKKR